MAYTDIDDPSAFFQTKIYTGNGANNRALTFDGNSDLQPNWLWIKNRSESQSHALFDSVRGATKRLGSNSTGAESTENTNLDSFDSNGFTVDSELIVNGNADNMVAWGWKESATAGFDIVAYTGNATGGRTVAHSLSAVPAMMIVKNRAASIKWAVYHKNNTAAPETDHLKLNSTDPTEDDDSTWNDTAPTSSVFSLGGSTSTNGDGTAYIAYLFADVQGFSKMGSYVGNGNADGTFVYTGFKPAMVICKKSSASGTNWGIIDNKRAKSFNQISAMLNPNSTGSEGANNNCDFVSNGFKWRTNDGNSNASATYIYMAFAENPFVTSTGVPATAR